MMNTSTNNADDYDLIERFFDFDLSATELQQLEQRLEKDTTFRERFHLFKEMDAHIENSVGASEEIDSIKQQFKATTSATTNKDSSTKKKVGSVVNMRRWLSIAAAVALVVASVVTLRTILQPKDPNALAMEYWNQTKSITFDNLRSDNALSPTEERLVQASELFDNQDYAAVIQSLSGIDVNDAQYPKVALLLGQSYFKQNQLATAETQFQAVLNHPSGDYRSSALWFQALTQLSADNKTSSINNLNEIIKQNYPLANKAKALVEQIQ